MYPRQSLCLGFPTRVGPCPLRFLSALASGVSLVSWWWVASPGEKGCGGQGAARTWPYPAFLHLSGGHDDDAGVLLPCHLPEVVDCGL